MVVLFIIFTIEHPVEPEPTINFKQINERMEFKELTFIALSAIRLYQFTLSGKQGDVCNFEPSCSRFAYTSIKNYGPFWGILMASDRLQRCNPFAFQYAEKYNMELILVPGKGYKIKETPVDIWRFK
jgi:putative component of membrane protein insertase Oxa1/YidC/SpoIIIJ protein YidD